MPGCRRLGAVCGDRSGSDSTTKSLGYMRGYAPDQVELRGIEAVWGILPVQAQYAPAPVLCEERSTQLVAEAERAHDLAVAGTSGPLTPGGPIERGDRVSGTRQRGKLIDIIAPELVLQEQFLRCAQWFVGGCGGEQQGHRVNSREERCVHRQHPAQSAQYLLAQHSGVQPGVAPANQGGGLTFDGRLRHNHDDTHVVPR